MKRKERKVYQLQQTALPYEPSTAVPETEAAPVEPDTQMQPVNAAAPKRPRKVAELTPQKEPAAPQLTRRDVFEKRVAFVRRTVRFGKFTSRSAKRVTGLIRRVSSLVSRVLGLPPKIKALTGFDIAALFSK